MEKEAGENEFHQQLEERDQQIANGYNGGSWSGSWERKTIEKNF